MRCKTYTGSDCASRGYDFEDIPRHYKGKEVFCYLRENKLTIPSGKRFTNEQRRLLASAVFDSFVFAGGLSVPSIISTALGVLFGKDYAGVRRNAGIDDNNLNTMTDAQISKLVYESLRLYPGVVGFPVVPLDNKMYYKDSKTATSLKFDNRHSPLSNIKKMAKKSGKTSTPFEKNDHDYHRTAFVLAAALRDEKVFPQPMEFKLRDLSLYESKVCVVERRRRGKTSLSNLYN